MSHPPQTPRHSSRSGSGRIVFYGNCQVQVLAQAYELFAVPHTGETVSYIAAAHALTDKTRTAIASADIVVDQITPMGAQTPIAGAPDNARLVHVPVVDGSFLWPYSGARHPESLRRYPTYHPFPMEMGDKWLLKRMASGATPDEAVAAYMSLDIAKVAHLGRRFEIAMDLQTAREAGTAFRFAPLIQQYFRSERLFRTPYHLEARLSRHMLLTLLQELDAPAIVSEVVEAYAVTTLFGGSDLPVHPGTGAHFGLSWANAAARYCFYRETMVTFEEYAYRFARCEAYPDMADAVEAVLKSQPDGPALLEAALANLPASPWGLHARAVLHLREERFAEALPIVRRVLELHPGLPGGHATLHDCLLGLGRTNEATDALIEEVRRAPFKLAQQMRLAQHFRNLGDVAKARSVVKTILTLNPHHGPAKKMALLT